MIEVPDDDIFDGIEAMDEVAALVLDQAGPEGLSQLFSIAISDGVLCREDLEKITAKLAAAGLDIEIEDIGEAPSRAGIELADTLRTQSRITENAVSPLSTGKASSPRMI